MRLEVLGQYHDAPVYQSRRDVFGLWRELEGDIQVLLENGRTAEWNSVILSTPSTFQFFPRNWVGDDFSFRWLSYAVERFTGDRVAAIAEYLRNPVADHAPSPLDLLKAYFRSEIETSHVYQSLDTVAHAGDSPANELTTALFHHELLNIYSRIATTGTILQHIWEDYTNAGNCAPAGYLVQVTGQGRDGGLPDFYSWDLLDGNPPSFVSRLLRQQYGIRVCPDGPMRAADEGALSRFFESTLFPLFVFPEYTLGAKDATIAGHGQEGLFGFVFVPVYAFHSSSFKGDFRSPANRFGDWLAVLQMELRAETRVPSELVGKPVFAAGRLTEFLRVLQASLDERIPRFIETSAVRWAETQRRADDPLELCAESIARTIGWSASVVDSDFDGPASFQFDDCDLPHFRLQLDWEWPQRRHSGSGAALQISPDPRSRPGAPRGRSPFLPRSREDWDAAIPEAYQLCRGIYRSIFTWWHAQRSRRLAISEDLLKLVASTRPWFGEASRLENSLPHTLPTITADTARQHARIVRRILPFLPESWWNFENDDRSAAVSCIHENLKGTFGAHACVTGGDRPLTVGGALILFLWILHRETPEELSHLSLGEMSFTPLVAYPLLPSQDPSQAIEAYSSLTALFRDVVKEKHEGKSAVNRIEIDPGGLCFSVYLAWKEGDRANFFDRFAAERVKLLPGGELLGNAVKALWSVVLAGSSGSNYVGRPGLLTFLRDEMEPDLILRIG